MSDGKSGSLGPPPPVEPHTPETVRRLLDEGLPDRAVEIARALLAASPGDAALRTLVEEAEAALAAARRAHARRHAPPAGEPFGMLDVEELPEAYGIDECEVIARDPHHLFTYWEVTEQGLAVARGHLGDEAPAAKLVLRLFINAASRDTRDHQLEHHRGRRYLPSPRAGVQVRAAVGLVAPSGLFAPIAHSSTVRVPPAEPAPFDPTAVRWMEVAPARTRGREREPIEIVRRDIPAAEHVERAPEQPMLKQPEQPPPPSSPWRWRPGSAG